MNPGTTPVPPGTSVDVRHNGHAHLVVVHPPFAAPLTPGERPRATAHDPEAARAAVLSLSMVASVRREDTPARLALPGSPALREHLDEVSVAVWGSTVKITDPALVEDGLGGALDDEFQAQRKRFPDARIVAVCERDFGAAYLKVLAAVPGAPDLLIEGFGDLDTIGDPRATLAAAGVDSGEAAAAYFEDDTDDEDDEDGGAIADFHAFLHTLTGGALSVYAHEERYESTFLVERTEQGENSIDAVWFP
ncbi:DUF6333 family protein [Streptomyces sp. NPDC059897]|uniref:DUF6333 family protein n=1 Tax=Streptomyces sp. NPDC059897 TaxID=3346994 RepID=UPI0036536575